MATTATTYTYAQLEQLWINAGGSKATAPIAAAIAEAESGGNPTATNATDNGGTQTSWGLWQISNGTHAQPAPNILDPTVNASQAVAKYQASGWAPWGTYTSGAYQAFLSNSTPPDPAGVPNAMTDASTTASSSSVCVTGEIFGFCPLSKSEARALIGGALMVAGGLIIFAGLVIIVAAGFQRTGAAAGAVNLAERLPGAGRIATRAAAAA